MKPLDLSLCYALTGVRGGGKTLFMTHLVAEALQKAWELIRMIELGGDTYANRYKRGKTKIWANYDVAFKWQPYEGARYVPVQSEKLDIEKLLVWDQMFHDGYIFIDEIDQLADRQDWYSAISKMLAAGVQVIRHRNLSLIFSIQSLNWLNARLQWQSDLIVNCRDVAFTPWGRENNVNTGEVIRTTWIDKSGLRTGYAFDETGQQFVLMFYGKRYWNCYQTHHEVDIIQMKTKYKLKMPEVTVDMTGNAEDQQKDIDIIHDTIVYYAARVAKPDSIKSTDFWDRCEAAGMVRKRAEGGVYLRDLGITYRQSKGQTYYDLTAVL